jgi:HD-GYP domain-containing protein (c-di-GMP phosphodiesterase class II)
MAMCGVSEGLVLLTGAGRLGKLRDWLPGAVIVEDGDLPAVPRPIVVLSDSPRVFSPPVKQAVEALEAVVVYVLADNRALPAEAAGFPVFFFLSEPFERRVVETTLRAASDHLRLRSANRELNESLERARQEIDELNSIGIALSAERDVPALLDLILKTSQQLTSSDAGSIYLVEENEQTGEKALRFSYTRNDSVTVPFSQSIIPIDPSRISSYVALKGQSLALDDAYHLPEGVPYSFSRDFDAKIGYRTKSVLAVPMRNPKGEVVGVLQLLNCKRDRQARVTPENADQVVIPYPPRVQKLLESMASQAAVALENARLYESIQKLFEGFVQASVVAIEARDPTTFGHSFRVEKLTVSLAETVDQLEEGPYRDVKFTREQLREIRYASVLHDFGKVGVREQVLVKAKKLYPAQLDIVRERFALVREKIKQEYTGRRLQCLLDKGREEYLGKLGEFDAELDQRLKEMDEWFRFLLQCNEPTVLAEGNFERLADLAARRYFDEWAGEERTLLIPDEVRLLSIPKGSLDPAERVEIESHVVHTFNFLNQIPWTKEIRNIPAIARAHHEKLDGTGYPFKLAAADIPIQSRMMTISDIYDALSASDRPYKRAVPPEKALGIIEFEVKKKLIDPELFRIFLEKQLWKLTLK